MDEYKSPEDKIREAVKEGAGRFGLCDACIHRIGYVCEFRPFRDLTSVPKIVSCPALKVIDETMLKKYTIISGRGAGKSIFDLMGCNGNEENEQ